MRTARPARTSARAHATPLDEEGNLGYAGRHVADHEGPFRSEIGRS